MWYGFLLLCVVSIQSATGQGARCHTVSDCTGLGDCLQNRCVCDPAASGAADCSTLAVLPLDWKAGKGYANQSAPVWSASYISDPAIDPAIPNKWHGFTGQMSPGFPNRSKTFGEPQSIHIVSKTGPSGPYQFQGFVSPNASLRVVVLPDPTGGFVAWHGSGPSAAYVPSLDGSYPYVTRRLFEFNRLATQPWQCAPHDWYPLILANGSILASFRNGGHMCPPHSYPGWPAEQVGLVRASCWNCSDWQMATSEPIFSGSNEDMFLFATHRGIHMLVHSQSTSDPSVSHKVRGALAFSPDGVNNWVISSTPAYNGSIALTNGTVLTAQRRQRPGLLFHHMDDGRVVLTHLTNAVDLTYNQSCWGDGWAIILPLKQDPHLNSP